MTSILIVDDSRVARLSLKRLVGTILPDAVISEADSADHALEVVARGEVTCALIDFNMPGRNGIELAAEIKAIKPAIRMALVTANIQDALAERARALGMAFIAKPPDMALMEAFLTGTAS